MSCTFYWENFRPFHVFKTVTLWWRQDICSSDLKDGTASYLKDWIGRSSASAEMTNYISLPKTTWPFAALPDLRQTVAVWFWKKSAWLGLEAQHHGLGLNPCLSFCNTKEVTPHFWLHLGHDQRSPLLKSCPCLIRPSSLVFCSPKNIHKHGLNWNW